MYMFGFLFGFLERGISAFLLINQHKIKAFVCKQLCPFLACLCPGKG